MDKELQASLDLMVAGHKNDLGKIKREAEDLLNHHVNIFMTKVRDAYPSLDFDFWTEEIRIELYDPNHPHFNGDGGSPDPTVFLIAGHELTLNSAIAKKCQEFIDVLNNTVQEYADNGMFLKLDDNYLPYGHREL